jgi:ribonuclease D
MIRYKKLSKDEINGMPLIKYEGDIKVFSKKDNIQGAVDYLLNQEVIGFDTETRPTFTKGPLNAPSIMQLAGGDSVFIFQLGGSRMFEKLSQVLSEKRITKCGVSVDRDLIELMYLSPFDPCSFIDLGDVARARGMPHHGLRGLAALLLKHRISKSSQTSDWSRRKLSDAQITYAATDAWISLELFKKLEQENII